MQPPTAHRQLLDVPAVAAALAVSPPVAREWIWRRRCPIVRVGRAVRTLSDWVENYIVRRTTPALPEREA
jgi:hypothetical protein